MSEIHLGIIGGGQLGSMLAVAAKKMKIKTIIYCDDINAPAQNFCDDFIFGEYDNKQKIFEFTNFSCFIMPTNDLFITLVGPPPCAINILLLPSI